MKITNMKRFISFCTVMVIVGVLVMWYAILPVANWYIDVLIKYTPKY